MRSRTASKRSRSDEGTESSPIVLDSDDDFAHHFQLARKRRNFSAVSHVRANATQQAPVPYSPQDVEEDSSDDEPLITRIQAKKSGVVRNAVPASFDRLGTRAEPSTSAAASYSVSQSALAVPARPPHHKRRIVGAFSSPGRPSLFSPFSQTSFPLYGEQKNLRSAFESVSKKSASKVSAAVAPRSLKTAAPVSFSDYAAIIGREGANLSSTLEGLSCNRMSSAGRPRPAAFLHQPGKLEDPFSSPPPSVSSRDGQAQNQPFPVRISKKLKPSVPARKSSANVLASSPAASASYAQPSAPALSPFTSTSDPPSTLRRRIPTPERLFTNMSVTNLNKLILTMARVKAEEARRSAKKKARTTAPLKDGSARKSGPMKKPTCANTSGSATTFGSGKAAEQYQDIDMTEDDDLDLTNVESGAAEAEDEQLTDMRDSTRAEVGGESDRMVIVSEDESVLSRAVAKAKKTNVQVDMSLLC